MSTKQYSGKVMRMAITLVLEKRLAPKPSHYKRPREMKNDAIQNGLNLLFLSGVATAEELSKEINEDTGVLLAPGLLESIAAGRRPESMR